MVEIYQAPTRKPKGHQGGEPLDKNPEDRSVYQQFGGDCACNSICSRRWSQIYSLSGPATSNIFRDALGNVFKVINVGNFIFGPGRTQSRKLITIGLRLLGPYQGPCQGPHYGLMIHNIRLQLCASERGIQVCYSRVEISRMTSLQG